MKKKGELKLQVGLKDFVVHTADYSRADDVEKSTRIKEQARGLKEKVLTADPSPPTRPASPERVKLPPVPGAVPLSEGAKQTRSDIAAASRLGVQTSFVTKAREALQSDRKSALAVEKEKQAVYEAWGCKPRGSGG